MKTQSNYEIAADCALDFYPSIDQGWVCKVYDGDTITVVAQLPQSLCGCHDPKKCPSRKYYKFHLRILGIDTPEMKSKSIQEKEFAIKARDKLSRKILHQIVDLGITGYDKYGRLLAQVRFRGEDICDWMIKNKLGVAYDGKKKTGFKSLINWNEL